MFVVEFSDGSILKFDSLELAKKEIQSSVGYITVDNISEFKSSKEYLNLELPIAQYKCKWTLTLEKIT